MKLTIFKKAPAAKAALAPIEVEVPDGIRTLRALLEALVCREVAAYNSRLERPEQPLEEGLLLSMLSEGRVTFTGAQGLSRQSPERAGQVAMQAFEDGLFRVVWNGAEVTALDAPLPLQDGDTLVLIMLTFLAGGF